jgi:ribosome modulation factor
MTASDDWTRAFNLGCQARLAGLPLSANPYGDLADIHPRRAWAEGWRHVDHYWGGGVRGRWRYAALPAVTEEVRT